MRKGDYAQQEEQRRHKAFGKTHSDIFIGAANILTLQQVDPVVLEGLVFFFTRDA